MTLTHAKHTSGSRSLTFWGQWTLATALTLALLAVLTLSKTGDISPSYRVLGVLSLLSSVVIYQLLHVYDRHTGYLTGITRLLSAWLIHLAVLSVLGFITKTSELYSREVLLQWSVLGFIFQAITFAPLHHFARSYHRQLRQKRTAAILGTGELALQLADKLVRNRQEPLVGLIQADDNPVSDNSLYPVLGSVSQLRDLIESQEIRRLYIALPVTEMEQVESLYIDLLDASVDVVWIPDLASLVMLNHSVSDIEGLPAIHLNESPLTSHPTSAFLKAALDRGAAALGILLISPLLLAVAAIIRITSPGPALFSQPRHGMNGEIFHVLKFRSMKVHNDKEVKQATRNDDRITPIGRFIRRTSIDELPQLINVLRGDMSLVGPRPHAVAHNDYYSDKITAYMARHRIKPGITGLAQISGCRGETETIDKMQQRVELDLQYINHWSLWLDIKILIKTPFTLFSKDIY